MSYRNLLLIKGLLSLLLVWAVAFGLMRWAGTKRTTPEQVIAFVEEHPLDGIDDSDERKRLIENLASMLNELEPSQLRELEEHAIRDPGRAFMEQLSPDEQLYFLERRIGRAFQQMMQSFNEMDREERKRIVERSLKRMQEGGEGSARLERTDPEIVEKMTEAGLKSYYQDASAETKLDLAPLLEEIQRSMTMMRGRR